MHAPSSAPPAPRTPLLGLMLAMGLMLSPDWLVILGNHVGLAGVAFLGVLVAASVIYWLAALSYSELHTYFPGPGGEAQALRAAFGSVPAIALPLCARVTFFVCASTLVLATAGYVFNEVFVRWFHGCYSR